MSENEVVQLRITNRQTMTAIAWAATILVISILLKKTPESWVNKIPIKIDENKPPEQNAITQWYDDQNKMKASDLIKKEETGDVDGASDYKLLGDEKA